MNMNIVEFLDEVGHTKLQFQLLQNAMTNITSVRGGSKITFMTAQLSPAHVATHTGKVGMVVWVDREDYERAMQKVNERTEHGKSVH